MEGDGWYDILKIHTYIPGWLCLHIHSYRLHIIPSPSASLAPQRKWHKFQQVHRWTFPYWKKTKNHGRVGYARHLLMVELFFSRGFTAHSSIRCLVMIGCIDLTEKQIKTIRYFYFTCDTSNHLVWQQFFVEPPTYNFHYISFQGKKPNP